MTPTTIPFRLARRCERMNPSALREILKVAERPGLVSLAGGLPSPELFPIDALREAARRVLADMPRQALQYAPSEGYGPLRAWVAERLRRDGLAVDADAVLITHGSQQGLDLLAKVLIDAGSEVRVESPTYLGALQAFTPFEPVFGAMAGDDAGPLPRALAAIDPAFGEAARFAYLVPSFQNPTGRMIPDARRRALAQAALDSATVIVEDDPYGELWYDAPPPPPIAASAPDRVIYLGSLSKVLSPGLRLGYIVSPPAVRAKLLQAKQAADLHTSGLTQRIAAEAIGSGLLDAHLPRLREHYRQRRDAMAAALARHFDGLADWVVPSGGMFFWLTLRDRAGRDPIDTLELLDDAVAAGVAFVPGRAFFVDGDPATAPGGIAGRSLRLGFVTATPERIEAAVATLAAAVVRRAERRPR